jgi:hypothetical protein
VPLDIEFDTETTGRKALEKLDGGRGTTPAMPDFAAAVRESLRDETRPLVEAIDSLHGRLDRIEGR